MKIKSQFRLLIFGIVVIPVVAFVTDAIYMWNIRGMQFYNEEFQEYLRLSELVELAGSPPALLRFLPFLVLLFILLFSVIMSLLIVRSITRSVAVLEGSTRRIANGELDLAVDVKGSNEITSLSNSLNKMRNALKEEERRRYFFIMGITHDIKTPLSLIKANVEAIEDGISAAPEEQKHSLHIINNKVDELEGMVNNLIDFIRIDSREIVRNVSDINLKSFLSSFIERISIDAELLHHKVESKIDLPSSLVIKMDSFLIQRALDNIANNSFRYTPNGACLFITAELDGPAVKLILSDNGNGIHEKDLPHIFDLFYRKNTSGRRQGMGIGLTITKSIIDSHSWFISVSSDGGTSFTITIPLS